MEELDQESKAFIHMTSFKKAWGNCRKCELGEHRPSTSPFFGAGNPGAPVMVVDMHTTYHEMMTGAKYAPNPQYGGGGGNSAIEIMSYVLNGVGLDPQRDVYFTNLMKCVRQRTKKKNERGQTENIDVTEEQVKACRGAFLRQFEIVKPAILVLQGKEANAHVLGDIRAFHNYSGHFRRFGPTCVALSTPSPAGFFKSDERSEKSKSEFIDCWRHAAIRLNTLGRIWRADAAIFKRGWTYTDNILPGGGEDAPDAGLEEE